jgi:16S rRNA (cytosine1402-N4)-methyltransferase
MPDAVIEVLRPHKGDVYVDLTAGFGSHAELVLAQIGKSGQAYLVDQDNDALQTLQEKFQTDPRVHILRNNFADIDWIELPAPDIIFADLGVSSVQLDEAERGFSFQKNGPLDMRMDKTRSLTAADLVNDSKESVLADILYQYGEEKKSRRIARAICLARQTQRIETTAQLAEVVRGQFPGGYHRIDPATRTFQALRIAVNHELKALEKMLENATKALKPGGRLAVISFHSLEDRMVKQKMRDISRDICDTITGQALQLSEFSLVTKKPLTAANDEIAYNPRARSAKLRAVEKKK